MIHGSFSSPPMEGASGPGPGDGSGRPALAPAVDEDLGTNPLREDIMPDTSPARSPLLVATLTAVLAVGCGDFAAPTASATRGQPDAELPFRLSGSAVLVSQDLAPGFGPPTFGRSDFDGRCSVPSDFVLTFHMEGRATHLGRYTADVQHCTQIDFASGADTQTDGVMTLTAADGDELWDRYEQTTPVDGIPEVHEFVGGTGRFSGAGGGGLGHPECDRAAGTCVFELVGTISFDPSLGSQ